MPPTYDFYVTLRSPYCWLIAPRLLALGQSWSLQCRLRPVYPLAIRPGAYKRDPLYYSYSRLDIERVAERLGLPLSWPRPDPVLGDRQSGDEPGEQPLVRWITALCVAADEHGRGLEYYAEVARLMWGGEVDGWHEGPHLAEAAERAGLDFERLLEAVARYPDRYHDLVLDNERAQRAAGYFGAPLMVLEGEPFYGQDRFEDFKWRLVQKGLQRPLTSE